MSELDAHVRSDSHISQRSETPRGSVPFSHQSNNADDESAEANHHPPQPQPQPLLDAPSTPEAKANSAPCRASQLVRNSAVMAAAPPDALHLSRSSAGHVIKANGKSATITTTPLLAAAASLSNGKPKSAAVRPRLVATNGEAPAAVAAAAAAAVAAAAAEQPVSKTAKKGKRHDQKPQQVHKEQQQQQPRKSQPEGRRSTTIEYRSSTVHKSQVIPTRTAAPARSSTAQARVLTQDPALLLIRATVRVPSSSSSHECVCVAIPPPSCDPPLFLPDEPVVPLVPRRLAVAIATHYERHLLRLPLTDVERVVSAVCRGSTSQIKEVLAFFKPLMAVQHTTATARPTATNTAVSSVAPTPTKKKIQRDANLNNSTTERAQWSFSKRVKSLSTTNKNNNTAAAVAVKVPTVVLCATRPVAPSRRRDVLGDAAAFKRSRLVRRFRERFTDECVASYVEACAEACRYSREQQQQQQQRLEVPLWELYLQAIVSVLRGMLGWSEAESYPYAQATLTLIEDRLPDANIIKKTAAKKSNKSKQTATSKYRAASSGSTYDSLERVSPKKANGGGGGAGESRTSTNGFVVEISNHNISSSKNSNHNTNESEEAEVIEVLEQISIPVA